MVTVGKKFYEWDSNPRMPVPQPPPGSCDCQFHIYDDPAKFPPRPDSPYPPIESATFTEALRMHGLTQVNPGPKIPLSSVKLNRNNMKSTKLQSQCKSDLRVLRAFVVKSLA